MNILDELYYGNLCGLRQDSTPTERRLSKELDPLYDQIETALGTDFLRTFHDRLFDLEDYQFRTVFHRGFRFGCSLLIDGLFSDRL